VGCLAAFLEKHPLDALYASPMRRVGQTMDPLIARSKKPPVVLPGLREVDFGAWTGLSWEQVQQRYQISAFEWLSQLESGAISEAESTAHFRERVKHALEQILCEPPGSTVGVVCHGGVIRMLLSLLLDLPFQKMAAFDIEYASITKVQYRPNKVEVVLHNFTPWRDLR
jgi:broad specificity phosphatase PhoE